MDEIRIAKTNKPVSVEVIIGNAQWGKYQIYKWDQKGANPAIVGQGVNSDDIADLFVVDPGIQLAGKFATWDIVIAAFNSRPDQLYQCFVIFRQDGRTLPGGVFTYNGKLQTATSVHGAAKFVA